MLNIDRTTDNQMIIQLASDFDAAAASDYREELNQIADTWTGDIEINMNDVPFIDSSGIGAIVFLHKRITPKGGKVILTGVNSQPMSVFHMLRIDRFLPITSIESINQAEV